MKKLNKFFAVLVALAMMATLCVCMAFAAPETATAAAGTYKPLDQAYLVKYLQIPEGVSEDNNPVEAFTFTVTPKSESANHTFDVPAINATGTVTIPAASFAATPEEGDGASVYAAIPLTQLFGSVTFPHNGVFSYEVTENAGTNEKIAYSEEHYQVNVYVKNGAVDGVTVQEETKDPTTNEWVAQDGKTNVTIQDPVVDENDDDDADTNDDGTIKTDGFTFTNLYTDNKGETDPDEPDPDPTDPTNPTYGALNVMKTVENAPEADANKAFPFVITLTAPIGHENDTYHAYKITEDGNTDMDVTFNAGSATVNVELKNGEAFVIRELPTGTKYNVNENLNMANFDLYTPEFDWTSNAATTPTHRDGQTGVALALADDQTLMTDVTTGEIADYTNTYDSSVDTPTGILINNLPYIALALVAIGGLVAYVVVRRRQNDEA